jgi:hypothetical protein
MPMLQQIITQLDSIGVSHDVVFTTSVTISIFVLGFVLNRVYDGWVRRRHLKRIRVFVVEYLKSIVPPIGRQVDAMQAFSTQLASLTHQDLVFQEDAIRSDHLKSISQLDVFDALVYGSGKRKLQRILHLNSVLEALDYIERLRRLAAVQFNYLHERYTQYFRDWNRATNAIQRHFDSYRSEASRPGHLPSPDDFLRELDLAIHAWQKTPNRDQLHIIHERYVQAVKQVCIKFFADPRSQTILPLTLNATDAFNNRMNLLTTMSAFYSQEARKLKERSELISQAVRAYE